MSVVRIFRSLDLLRDYHKIFIHCQSYILVSNFFHRLFFFFSLFFYKNTSQEGDYGQFQIYCTIDLLDVDEINFTANFQPCADEAEADFEVVEEDAGINYQTSYRGGEAETFPVPGLTVGIPVVGDANVVIAADIEGNLSELQVHIGLDACMTVWCVVFFSCIVFFLLLLLSLSDSHSHSLTLLTLSLPKTGGIKNAAVH